MIAIAVLGHIPAISQQSAANENYFDEATVKDSGSDAIGNRSGSDSAAKEKAEKDPETKEIGTPMDSAKPGNDSGPDKMATPDYRNIFLKPEFRTPEVQDISPEGSSPEDVDDPANPQTGAYDRFHWKPALAQSMYFLGIQHGMRMVQIKTRRELKGPFFADWGMSVKNLGKWRDGDSIATNYFAHPLQGAVTGRIFVNNSDRSKRQEFGRSKEYWESRFKAMLWSTVWSTQFEMGPLSEASIGNVGLYDREGPNRMGWVDLVITPTAGTGVMIGEDIIDKYILDRWLERKIKSRTRIKIYRTFFTPIQSFTNVLGGKTPWNRDNR
ncbi:MAG: hypothetical protein R2681_16890 [Pyrinomonadaceae bacterium]